MDNQPHLSRQERRELERQKLRANNEKTAVSSNKWRNISIATVVLIGVGVLIASLTTGKGSSTVNAAPVDTVSTTDWTKGTAGTGKMLLVFSDFQCPACDAYESMLNQGMTEFNDSVQFVFRNFPLRTLHPNAQIASQAAEAAGIQNKFWEMHDKLFEKQAEWSESSNPKAYFLQYAELMGLDKAKFSSDLESDPVVQSVEDDYQSGLKASVSGTPSFFFNGKKVDNFKNYDDLKKLLSS
jgi:protein-disulfide isomerase